MVERINRLSYGSQPLAVRQGPKTITRRHSSGERLIRSDLALLEEFYTMKSRAA